MFKRLKEKWNVGPWQLFFILCTFAVGGSLSGYLAKWFMGLSEIENRALYLVIYIPVVTIIWPFMVFFISFFFGQSQFFRQYLAKLGRRIFKVRKS